MVRRASRLLSRRGAFVGISLAAVTTAVVVQWRHSSSDAPGEKVPPLSAAEFNALFDHQRVIQHLRNAPLRAGLSSQAPDAKNPPSPHVTLYRLLGCPYCARVKALLDLLRIDYDEVLVDPLTGSGLPDKRYQFVPQLRVQNAVELESQSAAERKQETGDDIFVVESNEIIHVLSQAFSFESQLKRPDVAATRTWIASRYSGVTFAAATSSLTFAFHVYPQLVPEKYQNVFCRGVGALALFALARWKILPKLREAEIGGESPSKPSSTTSASIPDWLIAEAEPFTTKLRSSVGPFHGGKNPDVADVEMFATLRNIASHPDLRPLICEAQTPIGAWFREMDAFAQSGRRWP